MKPRALALGTVLAAVLVANNHLFKHLYPGPVTGKISDVAGVAVLALWIAGMLTVARVPWPRLIAGATAAGYLAWIKLTPTGSTFHEALVNAWMLRSGQPAHFHLARDASDALAGLAAPLVLLVF